MSNLPTKISPQSVTEAIFEVRFSSTYPSDAIFGIVYNQFKSEYPNKAEQLPILQLPAEIRENDPNLRYSPCYALRDNDHILQIGPRVFSLSNVNNYLGWKTFLAKISGTYNKLLEVNVIDKIERSALRFINIFENRDIFDHSTVKISLKDESLIGSEINLTTVKKSGNCSNVIRMINNAQASINNKPIFGSVIDIDTFMTNIEKDQCINSIELAHESLKSLFFSLLSEEFLLTLNPEY